MFELRLFTGPLGASRNGIREVAIIFPKWLSGRLILIVDTFVIFSGLGAYSKTRAEKLSILVWSKSSQTPWRANTIRKL